MFKCCVCNSSSKKAGRSREDDSPVGSPRIVVSTKEDDEIKSPTRVEKLNGSVQQSEKTSLLEDGSLEDKNASLENKNDSSKDKDASLENKDVSLEDKDAPLESKNVSLKDEDAALKDKDVLLEDKDASVEDKNGSLKDKDASLGNEDVSLEDKNGSFKDKDASLENENDSLKNNDVSLKDKDASLKDEDVSLEGKDFSLEDKDASLENKNVSLKDKDALLEDKNALLEDEIVSLIRELENKDALQDDKDVPLEDKDKDDVLPDFIPVCSINFAMRNETPQNGNTDAEESLSSTSTKETVEKAGEETGDQIIDDKDNSNFDGAAEDWTEEIDSIPVGPVKTNLYDASGYIERTIDGGPEDEGDDSVFEGENETIKKAPQGCESTDKEEHLEELVNRLENVTRRLENVHFAVPTQDTAVQTSTPSPKRSTSGSSLLSKQEVILNPPTSMSLAAYKDFLAGPVKEYLLLSYKIGGDVATHSSMVEVAFQIQLQFIQMAASRPAPTNQSEKDSVFGRMSGQIQIIQEFREMNRGSPVFNHLSAISESIPALGWVAVSPAPAPYVKEMNDAGQFYTNRVLKDWKEKDKIHINWCKAWVKTLTDLQQYVHQHHTTGFVWGKTGAVPCIPPPPPALLSLEDIAPKLRGDKSALFAQINQGEKITKSLKKVTSDMQTHKNPALRSGPAPFKAPTDPVFPANSPIDKPPVYRRDGKKWRVEYQKGQNFKINTVEMNNVVYVFRCQDSTFTIEGKINSIVMDSCRKSSIVFDSVVSGIEFVNCQSVQMQVLGKVPTISIDKTDGCQMYLSAESLGVELITSKSSEMNVMVPKPNGDYSEYPVPEQFKTTISKNGLSTMAVNSLG